MAINNERLDYILQDRTVKYVSRETGIPYTTLYYFAKGERGLPTVYSKSLTDFYKTEAYRRLRVAGANSYEANQYKFKTPDIVSDIEKKISEKVDYFTKGAVLAFSGYNIDSLTKKEYDRVYETLKEKVIKGLRKNKTPLEDKVKDLWESP